MKHDAARFPQSLPSRLRPRRRRGAAHEGRRSGLQRRARRSPCCAQAAAEGAVLVGLPGARPLGLHLRRPVPPAGAARRLRGGAGPGRRGDRARSGDGRHRRPAAARRPPLFNCAAVVRRRPRARRRAQDLPAELRRVLRGAPVPAAPTTRSLAERDAARRRRAVRRRPDLRGRRPAAAEDRLSRSARTSGCRSRRRRYAALAGATVLVNLSASNITIGKADYRHRLVGLQSSRCLAAYLYSSAGPRRVDHRPRLGRPGADLRERRPAGRVGALRHRLALHQRRRRPGAGLARADAAEHVRHVGRASTRDRLRALPPHAASRWRCRRQSPAPAPHGRALPVRARPIRRGATSAAGGLQHPGPGAAAAAGGDRHQEAGDRHLGRARLDPCAAGLRRGDGPCSACRAATSSPTRCPASPPASARSTRRAG